MRKTFYIYLVICLSLLFFAACNQQTFDQELSFLVSPESTVDAQTKGAWSNIIDWPLIAIHAALTPDGKVLTYGTDEQGTQGAQFIYDVWNPANNSHNTLENRTGTDIFCSAQTIDPSTGNIMITGGDDRPNGNRNNGVNDLNFFDYRSNSLSKSPLTLTRARWYPTTTTLADGRIVLQGGKDATAKPVTTPELYSNGGWSLLTGATSSSAYGATQSRWWYPRSFLAPDGRIFGIAGSQMYYLDPSGNGSISLAGTRTEGNIGETSTAVMYRPGLILQAGGGGFSNGTTVQASKAASIIDIRNNGPVVTAASSMSYRRHWSNGTVLPDGTILITGGSEYSNKLTGVANEAEIWNPDTNTWTLGAAGDRARLYHSIALLLPDATVLVAGGGAPGPQTNTNAEIYFLPYLFNKDNNLRTNRPLITNAPKSISYGQAFTIGFENVRNDKQVSLVRLGSVTHSFNFDQRFVPLSYTISKTTNNSGTMRITAPSKATVAPPGYYMLFVTRRDGTPSVAKIVELK